ncbi:MAG: hypothetical protein ACI3WU_03190 [Phascolarctobacterium sp.]
MDKKELEKLGVAALADIVYSELLALNALIQGQQETINKLDNSPTRDLSVYFCESNRMSGYTVARDMLLRFIKEQQQIT